MARYRGVELADDVVGLIRHMEEVEEHREALQALQSVWDSLSMLGELSGLGVQIGGVRADFSKLTGSLLNHLGAQALRKTGMGLQARARVAIDILVRNLFERTADIGFLATDHDLRTFAEAAAEQREASRAALLQRLRAYRCKYSVYQDIVLLAPDGLVLACLDENVRGTVSRDPLVREALASGEPYLERYGPSDLRPGPAPALVYACRVMGADGRKPVAVLCLCFDFADECRRIFEGLGSAGDWGVLALLDARGATLASSDSLQLPLGSGLPLPAGALAAPVPRILRFGGRRWLALTCAAQGYQGYAGPGWLGHAMVPLEHAFEPVDGASGEQALQALSPAQRAALMASPQLFSPALRDIAPAAARIETELQRTVWNGNISLGAQPRGRDAQFSRTLLREIGRTGGRSREVFSLAIAQVNQTVVSAMLHESQARAALAVDIMDRNLYERANDCRWWALTSVFRQLLAAPEVSAAAQAELTRVLQTIHGLYTVYANLLLFDGRGRVVAVSREQGVATPGRELSADWVQDCLALPDSERYCVSRYEASDLYGGALTCIYAAAVRAPDDERRVVGGIAIVFDARPQFEAMLQDSAGGEAFAAFVEADGRVIASSHPDMAAGSLWPAGLLPEAGGPQAGARIVAFEQQLYALGASRSCGYREFKSPQDLYRHEVSAVVMVPLAALAAADRDVPQPVARLAVQTVPSLAADMLDVASFVVSGQWYGLPCGEVLEAVAARQLTPLTRNDARLCGTLLHRGRAIAVFDLAVVLHSGAPPAQAGPVIVMRDGDGRPAYGLRVEALGEHLQLPASQLERLDKLYPRGHAFIESLARVPQAAAGTAMLQVLSAQRLAAALLSVPAAQPDAVGMA